MLYDVGNVPASLLPYLAEQFNVFGDAGWDIATDDDARRALIREAIALHKIKGTPYAVRRALDLMGVVALMTEWWQRDPKGVPHTFSVAVSLKDQPVDSPAIDAARIDDIRRVVTFWKPVRSHFTMSVSFDPGAETRIRIVSVFSSVQRLESAGQLQPFTVTGSDCIRIVSVVSAIQLLDSTGL